MSDQKLWVMVVDDDELNREIVAKNLNKKGFQVICAPGGEEGMEILRFCTPDCIILDLLMPKVHGHAFLSWLRKKNQTLPVVIMSGVKDPAVQATLEKLGISGWLGKPIRSDEVEAEIFKALGPESAEEKTA